MPDGRALTIVVPTYRRPGMLGQCLASIRDQSFTDYNVLVCDNAADRVTASVVTSMGDPRFTYLPRSENLGILHNVFDGLQRARTPLVMEVDDDDYLLPGALAALVDPFTARPDLAVSFSRLTLVDGSGKPRPAAEWSRYVPPMPRIGAGVVQPFTALAAAGLVYLVSAVLRRDAIDWSFSPHRYQTAYDRYLVLAASRGGSAAYFVDEPLVAYRVHDASEAQQRPAALLSNGVRVLEDELVLRRPEERHAIADALLTGRLQLVRAFVAEGNLRSAWNTGRAILTSGRLLRETWLVCTQRIPAKVAKMLQRLVARWSGRMAA
ncbi:MAG: glycosyltransferase family 2 protein [Nostocoides sp.]